MSVSATEVREASDRLALRELCDRYLLMLDEGRFDESRADSIFTEGVLLTFPPGSHRGITGMDRFTAGFMGHWARTQHHPTSHVIDLDGDRASIAWNVIAIHVHPNSPAPPAPGNHFYVGGRFDGTAVRTARGWRLERLGLRVIWTTGTGVPSIAAVMAVASEDGQ